MHRFLDFRLIYIYIYIMETSHKSLHIQFLCKQVPNHDKNSSRQGLRIVVFRESCVALHLFRWQRSLGASVCSIREWMNEFSLSCSSFLPMLVGVVSKRQKSCRRKEARKSRVQKKNKEKSHKV
jgi:hypothetical protein